MSDNGLPILLHLSNSQMREIIIMILESEFDLEIVESNSLDTTVEKLSNNNSIAFKIVLFFEDDVNTIKDIYPLQKDHSESNCLILSGSTEKNQIEEELKKIDENFGAGFLKVPFDTDEFTFLVKNQISSSKSINTKEVDRELKAWMEQSKPYLRVKIKRLMNSRKIHNHVFIKISEDKYLKIFSRGQLIDKARMESFQNKGVEYLYVKKDEFKKYVDKTLEKLKDNINSLGDESLDEDEVQSLQLESIEQIQDFVLSIGVSSEIINLTDKLVDSVVDNVKNDKNIKSLLSNIEDRENFLYEHSHLVNYFVTAISQEMDWDSAKINPKLIFASLFADLSLDDPAMAIIYGKNDPGFQKLKPKEQKILLNHPHQSIDLIHKSKENRSDEIKLIVQHHERADGEGFPRGLNHSNIPITSAVFNLAYEFSRKLILSAAEEECSPLSVLESLPEEYRMGHFEKPYKILKSVLNSEEA